MANYYVRSAAAGAANGTSWANAYTTILGAMTGKTAGDTFWVADDHAETQGSAIALASVGTAGAPCRILCVNTHATEPPTGLAATATVTTTGNFGISFTGYAYAYGITWSAGSGVVFAGIAVDGVGGWVFDTCVMKVPGTAAGGINLGTSGGNMRTHYVEFINTQVNFAVAGHGIVINGTRFVWRNTASAVQGTVPTILFRGSAAAAGDVEVTGVDLSALGSGKSLVNVAIANSAVHTYRFRDCKLGASVSAISGAILGPGEDIVYLENCDSGNVNYRDEKYMYQGSVKQETTKVRTAGGATDGATTISHNMTSLATGPTLFSPLESIELRQWNQTVTQITVTVELCTENVTLTDAECWLEVQYLGTASLPLAVLATSRAASAFATPANLTTSAVAWSGFTVAAPQKLSLTFTPAIKGLILAKVMLAKANATVYVDPQITVTNGPVIGRSYLQFGGAYGNETGGARPELRGSNL